MLQLNVNHASKPIQYDGAMENIGTRLRNLREMRDLTLEQVASAVGVTAQALSQLERGITKHVRPENFLALCAFYDVDPYRLALGKQKSELAAEIRARRATRPA